MFETATLELLDFIRRSPVCYHAVANLAERLEAAGYVRLRERDGWSVAPGGKYYVLRGGSSLIAFAVPEGEWRGFRIAASHSDSPCFKLKPDAEIPVIQITAGFCLSRECSKRAWLNANACVATPWNAVAWARLSSACSSSRPRAFSRCWKRSSASN